MSDSKIRELERHVRGGDESFRLELTFARLRARSGFMLAWEGRTVGVPVFWVEQKMFRFTMRTFAGVPQTDRASTEIKPRRRTKHGLAVLDLDDAFALAQRVKVDGRPPGQGFELIDLASGRFLGGCYPRLTPYDSISADPPARSPRRRARTRS